MKRVTSQLDALHLFVAHLASGWIFSTIQSAPDLEALRGGCSGDEIDDRFIIAQRLAAPVG